MGESKRTDPIKGILERSEALPQLDGLVVGVLAGWSEAGLPLVDFAGNPGGEPVEACSLVGIGDDALGSEAGLLFESGDPRRPVVIGIVNDAPRHVEEPSMTRALRADVDGETVTLSADRELVLRCGKASITLTSAGKVLLRGAYLLSRSSGANRIKGGSVQIN
jgi:hypothetical protein